MAGRAFADTNIVLRLLNDTLPEYQIVSALVDRVQADDVEIWINRQIIREYLVQVTRPGFLFAPLPVATVEAHVSALRRTFVVADETDAVTDALIKLLKEIPFGGKQVHDANIVATMLVHGIDTLLTTNTDDLKRFAGKITILTP